MVIFKYLKKRMTSVTSKKMLLMHENSLYIMKEKEYSSFEIISYLRDSSSTQSLLDSILWVRFLLKDNPKYSDQLPFSDLNFFEFAATTLHDYQCVTTSREETL